VREEIFLVSSHLSKRTSVTFLGREDRIEPKTAPPNRPTVYRSVYDSGEADGLGFWLAKGDRSLKVRFSVAD